MKVEQLALGKRLDTTIDRARHLAKAKGVLVLIVGDRQRVILDVSPQGDVNETKVPALRVKLGEFVVEQILRETPEGETPVGPAVRLMEWWTAHQPQVVRKAA